MSSAEIRIAAKELGSIAMPDWCPRCSWVKLHAKRLPYQTFPGIFSSIDSYTKKVIHGGFDNDGEFPSYLSSLGELSDYINPPHYSKYQRRHAESGVTVWGSPDAIFKTSSDEYVIADYKTAKFTETQDKLLPIYTVQLNAYAFIGESSGFAPVSNLALLYFQPETESQDAIADINRSQNGFRMGFRCFVKPVALDPGCLWPLLSRVRELAEATSPPPPEEGCKECGALETIISLLRR